MEKNTNWHTSEKVMTGVIIGLILNLVTGIGNTLYVAKTLTTTPPIPERVLALEIKVSEFGKTLDAVNDTMKETNNLIRMVHTEQARRKPIVDYVEKTINKSRP